LRRTDEYRQNAVRIALTSGLTIAQQCMSGKGYCYDNAVVDTFFKTPSRDIVAQYPAGQ